MPSPPRLVCLCAAVAVVVAAVVYLASPGGVFSPFEDDGRTERLNAQREMQNIGDDFNGALAADLVAGRASLAGATAAAVDFNRERDDFLPTVRSAFPAPPAEASVAALLIARGWHAGGDDPGRRRAAARRLAAEYRDTFGVPFPTERAGQVLSADLAGGGVAAGRQ